MHWYKDSKCTIDVQGLKKDQLQDLWIHLNEGTSTIRTEKTWEAFQLCDDELATD